MLLEFQVENYKSIRNPQKLSFVGSNYSPELPDNYTTINSPGLAGARILRALAVYGPNASGKSNLLSAFSYFCRFAGTSFSIPAERKTGVVPFAFDEGSQQGATKFEATLFLEGCRYTYGLALNGDYVTEEYLVAFPNGRVQIWFEREWQPDREEYTWSPPNEFFKYDDTIKASTRNNCSFLSTGTQFNHEKLTTISRWFSKNITNCTNLDPTATAKALDSSEAIDSAQILKLITSADLGISNLTARRVPSSEFKSRWGEIADALPENFIARYDIEIFHRSGDQNIPLSFYSESEGTKKMFSLSGPWLSAIKQGHLILIDEIESSLHPFLVRELIALLLSPKTNPNNAQLLFTTHNPLLLDNSFMRRDQFWFTEKDNDGGTHIYPLTDHKPRQCEALMRGYIAGRYGGLPFIPEGLLPQ